MRRVLAGRVSRRTALLILSEHALIVASVLIGAVVRGDFPHESAWGIVNTVLRGSLIGVVLQVCLHYCDLYDLRTLSDHRGVTISLLRALGATSLVLAFVYYWIPALIVGRGVFVISSVIIVGVIAGWRIAFDWWSLHVKPAERLLLVGTSGPAVTLARELFDRRQELGVELVGFVDPDTALVGTSLINPGVVGTIDDIPVLVRERGVDRVVVSLADARGKLSMDQLLEMKLRQGVRFDHLASLYEEYTGKIAVENLRPSWLIFSDGFRHRRAVLAIKRTFDVVASALALLIASPFIAGIALALRFFCTGPVLYHQRRVGKDGKIFLIHKFRSMYPDAEAATGAIWSSDGDPRVTPIGRFLRRTRLDELPQLWNVVRGDMSLVGPRPERPEFVDALTKHIPFYGLRHAVRPGITGWAQVRYEYSSSVESSMQKLQYDLFYIKHISNALDVFIILETIKTVLVRPGS